MRLARVLRYCRHLIQFNRYCVFLLVMFCQLACQQERPLRPAQPNAFFPLIPGTTWKYQIIDEAKQTTAIFTDRVERTEYAGSGSELMTEDSRATTAPSETIVSETSGTDGQELMLYRANNQYIARSISFGSLKDGLADQQIISTELAFLPLVLKPGVSWSNTVFPFGSILDHLKIVQTHIVYAEDEVVTVPGGHFSNCIRIETSAVFMSDSSSSQKMRRYLKYVDWYAPSVGLIKTAVRQAGLFGREIARVELIQFRQGSFTGNPLRPNDGAEHKTATHPSLMD